MVAKRRHKKGVSSTYLAIRISKNTTNQEIEDFVNYKLKTGMSKSDFLHQAIKTYYLHENGYFSQMPFQQKTEQQTPEEQITEKQTSNPTPSTEKSAGNEGEKNSNIENKLDKVLQNDFF